MLGSFVDVRNRDLKTDDDQFMSIENLSTDEARFRNHDEARKFQQRKVHGPSGIAHRMKEKEQRKIKRLKKNMSKQSLLLNEPHAAFSPSNKSIWQQRRSIITQTKEHLSSVEGGSPQNWPTKI